MTTNWQAPSTHNVGDRKHVVTATAGAYLDGGGVVRWWTGDIPAGGTLVYVVDPGDGRRVFSTDAAGEHKPLLFGGSTILIR